ncbi:MAG: hypothetical protein ACI93R_002940 [Flavobacteriales bacterium]|jgi:uncharacterized protein
MSSVSIVDSSNSRIDAVDALRGMALIGVGFVHMLEQYTAAPMPEDILAVANAGGLNVTIEWLKNIFLIGKFYLIFSLLFGLSFFIQLEGSAERKSAPALSARFTWRLLILLGFGYLHHLFYRGDILMLYALMGTSLLLIRKLSSAWLLAISVLMFLGLGRLISFAFFNHYFSYAGADDTANVRYFEALRSGSLWDVFVENNWGGIRNVFEFQFSMFGRGYMTFGMFLMGIYLGRSGFFRNFSEKIVFLKKTAILSGVVGLVFFIVMIALYFTQADPEDINNWTGVVILSAFDVSSLGLAVFYSCLFLMACSGARTKKIIVVFAPYGRLALSNYIIQGVMGSFIFFAWGLGFLGVWTNSFILVVAVVVCVAQIIFSRYWLKHFHFGPLEWIWRCLTRRELVAIKRGIADQAKLA